MTNKELNKMEKHIEESIKCIDACYGRNIFGYDIFPTEKGNYCCYVIFNERPLFMEAADVLNSVDNVATVTGYNCDMDNKELRVYFR